MNDTMESVAAKLFEMGVKSGEHAAKLLEKNGTDSNSTFYQAIALSESRAYFRACLMIREAISKESEQQKNDGRILAQALSNQEKGQS